MIFTGQNYFCTINQTKKENFNDENLLLKDNPNKNFIDKRCLNI